MQNIRYSSHRRSPPMEATEDFFPSFVLFYCLQALKHSFQLPVLFSLDFEFFLGHSHITLKQRFWWFMVLSWNVSPGKGGAMQRLCCQCPENFRLITDRHLQASALKMEQLYIYLFLMQYIGQMIITVYGQMIREGCGHFYNYIEGFLF